MTTSTKKKIYDNFILPLEDGGFDEDTDEDWGRAFNINSSTATYNKDQKYVVDDDNSKPTKSTMGSPIKKGII